MNLFHRCLCWCVLLGSTALPALADERPDIVVADFEGSNYGEWKTTGEAFGTGPARGSLPGQMAVEGFEGKGLVNSFIKGDPSTGTLTSPPLTLERKFLVFLIGGGKHSGQTCINLLLDGKVVRTASGPNGQPGGSERLDWHSWDVAELSGKTVVIQIVDAVTGSWGHINIDEIRQSDTRRGTALVQREILIERDYLHFPVKNGAPKRLVKLLADGRPVREFEIELANQNPDFVTFLNVQKFKGQRLTIEAELPFGSKLLNSISAQETTPAEATVYTEKLRPQFHFTSRRGWLNDPNGLVYLDGEWHLFYQHNPYGWNWGNMHWGHAVSHDLFHWRELPEALYPHRWGDFAFSGSAVVDKLNEAGFRKDTEEVLVAFYTSTGRGECLAFSNDKGRTWTDYDKNPVVKHEGRDPKVIWHGGSKNWVMAVYDEAPNIERGISFYTSKNLREWIFASRITGFFECPDLFELPVSGSDQKLWILYGADGQYLLGNFDGQRFQPTTPKQRLWHGNFYAAQTYSDAPDGRRVQIGWASGITFPGMPFNQQMTVPVELTLQKQADEIRMFAWPVKEIAGLKGKSLIAGDGKGNLAVASGENVDLSGRDEHVDLFDLSLQIEVQKATKVVLSIQGTPVTYEPATQKLTCRNVTAALPQTDGKIRLRILGDRNSLEIFGNGGQVALSVGGLPSDNERAVRISADGGDIVVNDLVFHTLNSAWNKP